MLCEKCKQRKATVFLMEYMQGEKREQCLCEQCAAEVTSIEMKTAGGVLSGMPSNSSEKKNQVCPKCGLTYGEMLSTGKLGCAQCYKTFHQVLESGLPSIQGATRHVGKVPVGYKQNRTTEFTDIPMEERLEISLQEAIETEEFERAAQIRDQLRELRQQSASSGKDA
ncbi:MAG: UvrB/UvrC motif-containing protein [Lachnospiraceae bacterium]|nr:UvrB/UvrC motif-containing protein [Lachnospiraceae bacterium]